MAKKAIKRNSELIINILSAALGVFIAYSIFVTFVFLYTSNALEDAENKLMGIELQNDTLRSRLDTE